MTGILFAVLASVLVEHAYVRPLPGSRVVADDERDGELVVTYRDEGSRVRRTVAGRLFSIEYEISNDVTAEDVVAFFSDQVEELEGGDMHRATENRLTFSFRRSDGGTTWCQIWATDGNYTLELVDEAPERVEPRAPAASAETAVEPERDPEPEPEPEPESELEVDLLDPERESAPGDVVLSLALPDSRDVLPEGVGALLDDVVARLERSPGTKLEIRVSHDAAVPLAERVRDTLVLFGVPAGRLTTSASAEPNERDRWLQLVVLPPL